MRAFWGGRRGLEGHWMTVIVKHTALLSQSGLAKANNAITIMNSLTPSIPVSTSVYKTLTRWKTKVLMTQNRNWHLPSPWAYENETLGNVFIWRGSLGDLRGLVRAKLSLNLIRMPFTARDCVGNVNNIALTAAAARCYDINPHCMAIIIITLHLE